MRFQPMDHLELAARLAREAYRRIQSDADSQARFETVRGWIPDATSVMSTEDGFGAFCVNAPGRAYLFIRGTQLDDLQDLLRDGDILPASLLTQHSAPLVHGGFLRARNDLRPWVIRLGLSSSIQLIIGGHSAGGDVAELFAVDLPGATDVYTFGAAKLGFGPGFCDAYTARDLRTSRVVHADDLVPRVLGSPYEHPCPAITLTDDGAFTTPPTGLAALVDDLTGDALAKHHIEGYVWACAANAARRRLLDQTPLVPASTQG